MNRVILGALFLLLACGKPITTEKATYVSRDPLLSEVLEESVLGLDASLNFDLLPLKGKVKDQKKFWSGNAWPMLDGAINHRWNSPLKETLNYTSPSRREVITMPMAKLRELSPAEKYDLYMGRYDYPLKREVEWIAKQATESWEGLCHGWAGASINHPEPGPRIMVNPDGVEVPFGSADIKAILSYAYSRELIGDNDTIGKRCRKEDSPEDANCSDDLSALTFHTVLTNLIGLRGKSFIADLDRYKEVWNYPIVSYSSEILQMEKVSRGRKVVVRTSIEFLDVIKKNSWEIRAPSSIVSRMTFEYELKLDEEGNMIDSRWRTRERPDFLWVIHERENFKGYFEGVRSLLK